MKQEKQCKCDVILRRICSNGKAINITHSACLYGALVIQHEMRMRRIILSFLACLKI